MRKSITALFLMCAWLTGLSVYAESRNKKLNEPVPDVARELVKRGISLAEHDRLDEAIAALKKAIAIAPQYVNAHVEYIQMRANFQGRSDEVRAEYEALMAKNPANPIYPMAMASARYQTSQSSLKAWDQRVVELAPDWTWTHIARARLLGDENPEAAVAEYQKFIEKDGSWGAAYWSLVWIQNNTLKRIDDAIASAQKMADHPEFRADGLSQLWPLRVGKAGGTQEAIESVKRELDHLAVSSQDVKILNSVRLAYSRILKDEERAHATENKIRRIDHGWYPERGKVLYVSARNTSGVSRLFVAVNRQFSIFNKLSETGEDLEPNERIAKMEEVLALNPGPEMKRYIYELIFRAAEKAGDTAALVKYGDALYSMDPTDVAVPAKTAIVLANQKKDPQSALRYARLAESATTTFRPVKRPPNHGENEAEWHKDFTDEQQQTFYKSLRALALDAYGWTLCQVGRCQEGEKTLRQSVELARTENGLFHLAEILNRLGTKAEAAKLSAEAKGLYAASIRRRFKNDLAKDFELTSLAGLKVKLSDLKGKVVMIDFWATWCGPCIKSIPTLKQLSKKYEDQGLEILYISIDGQSDKYKVVPFAKQHNVDFTVLLDEAVQAQYGVKSVPTTLFIDRAGKLRFRHTGFNQDDTPRMFEIVIEELLKTKSQG